MSCRETRVIEFQGNFTSISSDDDTRSPIKSKISDSLDIKENIATNMSNSAPNSASKFKFKVRSDRATKTTASAAGKQSNFFIDDDDLEDILPFKAQPKEAAATSSLPSGPARTSPETVTTAPTKIKPFSKDQSNGKSSEIWGKQSKFFIEDEALEDILPFKTQPKEATAVIKPEPLFKLKSKPLESSIRSVLSDSGNSTVFKPKIPVKSPPVEKILQNEREVNMTFAKSSQPSSFASAFQKNIQKKTFQFVDTDTDCSPNETPTKEISLSREAPSSSRPSTSSTIVKKNEEYDSPISSFYQRESLGSNSPTPENSQKSATICIKVDDQEVDRLLDACPPKQLDNMTVSTLREEKSKFQDMLFKYYSPIPLSFFESIEGFDKRMVVRLKGMIQSIDMRIKRQSSHNAITPTPPRSRQSAPTPMEVSKFVPKIGNDEDDDEQLDYNEIIKSIADEEQKCNGKFNNSYVDLSHSPAMKPAFQPRVNRKDELAVPRTQLSTIIKDHEHIELDDDGFEMVDYASLQDVIPSRSSASAETSMRPRKQTIDSMIPDNTDDLQFKHTSSVGVFYNSVKNDGISGEFDGMNYPFSSELQSVFQTTFGLRKFRQNQLQAINAALLGHDCFILMPTGGGKSLCYQLPAILSKGITIVISPLKSLILDQVNKLNSLDIKAVALSADMSQAESREIYNDLNKFCPKTKLLYVTPEKISASTFFQDTLSSMYTKKTLSRIVIDEAHCVSTWGHDFRPDYKKLGELKKRFPTVPVMALTATANIRVRADVIHQLKIEKCKWFLSSFNRPNLKYIVTQKTGAKSLTDIINLIKTKFLKASGIIYCLSRKDCDSTAEKLQIANIKAVSYHAGMTDKVRERVQKDWLTDKYRVVCATIAFGMGIDKPDVRYVIHYSMPKSIEGYYQESGRAGRDGELATCILYYSYADKCRLRNMMINEPQNVRQVSMNNLDLVVNFCENMIDCRRTEQLNYFGEHFTREQCLENRASACDNCTRVAQYKNIDVTEICRTVVSAVQELCERSRFTILQMVDVFKGAENKKVIESGHKNTRYHGFLKQWERTDIQRLFHKLVIDNYLREDITVINDIPISYIKIGPSVANVMRGNNKIQFAVQEKKPLAAAKKVDVATKQGSGNVFGNDKFMDELKDECFRDLKDLSRMIAEENNVTMSTVMNMVSLQEMSARMPNTEAEMFEIPHVTKANYQKYGYRFLEICKAFRQRKTDHEIAYELQRAEDMMMNACSDDFEDDDDFSANGGSDNVDWDALGRQASSGSGSTGARRGGYKRRGSTRAANIAKRYKKSGGYKRKTPAKKASSAVKRGKTTGGGSKALLPPPRLTF